jgi:hypothetical protein
MKEENEAVKALDREQKEESTRLKVPERWPNLHPD